MKKISLLLVLVLLLSACGPIESTDAESKRTIVSMAPNITEILYAIDLGDSIVGRTDYDTYPAEVEQVESIGAPMEPDVEKIIGLQPDYVVYVYPNPDLYSKIEEAGIETVQFEEVATVDEIYGLIEQVGATFGQEDKAKQVATELKNQITAVAEKVAQADPVSVYYVVGFGSDGDFTATGDTFIHQLVTMAGGDNIAKDATGWSYNLESLISADPSVIITSNKWDMKQNFINADNYAQLTAVKQDKVYEIDGDLVEFQGPRIAQGIEALAKILHPDLFQ